MIGEHLADVADFKVYVATLPKDAIAAYKQARKRTEASTLTLSLRQAGVWVVSSKPMSGLRWSLGEPVKLIEPVSTLWGWEGIQPIRANWAGWPPMPEKDSRPCLLRLMSGDMKKIDAAVRKAGFDPDADMLEGDPTEVSEQILRSFGGDKAGDEVDTGGKVERIPRLNPKVEE